MNADIDAVRVADTPDGTIAVVVLARDDADDSGDVLPIFVGFEEAASIARGLDAVDIGRPLTHDVTLDLVEELGGRVDRVVISSVESGTYFADLHVETPRGSTVVDARPSDSLALAARTNAPIAVADDVFAQGARSPDGFDELRDIREVMGDE